MINATWRHVAFFLALLFASPFALADGGETVFMLYTLGSGSAVHEVISGVAGIVDRGSGISTIMVVLALLGIIVMSAKIGTQSFAIGQFIGYLLTIWVISVMMFNIKVTVVVADRVNNYYNTVQNVPMLFAAPAALISQAGDFLTEKIETHMSLPDQLKITGGGQFNLVAKVVADGSNYKLTDPYLRMSINNYIADCAVPGMARRSISLDTLRKSTDIWADLKFTNAAVMTRYAPMTRAASAGASEAPAGAGADSTAPSCGTTSPDDKVALLDCTTAHACIQADLATHAAALSGNADIGDLAESGLLRPLGDMMTSSYTWLTGGGIQGAGATGLSQRIMANSLAGTFRAAAAQAGNNELITTAAVTQAVETQRSGWVTGAAVFNDLMGYLFIVLQVVIYGLAPFVAVLLFAPGFGMRGGLAYAQLMVWVALWEPLLALVNFVVAIFARSTIGDTLFKDNGFTYENAAVISEQANNLMAAAGFMGTMVPMLAWQLAKGTMSMMDFVSQGSGSSAAAQAGASSATGNLSYGSVSIGGTSLGKADMTSGVKMGYEGVTASNTPIGGLTRSVNFGGQGASANAMAVKNEVASGESLASAERAAQAQTMDHRTTETANLTKAAQDVIQQAKLRATQVTNSTGKTTQVGEVLNDGEMKTVAAAIGSGIQQSEQLARAFVKSNEAALAASLGLKGGYDHQKALEAAAGNDDKLAAVKANAKLNDSLKLGRIGAGVAGAAAGMAQGFMMGGPAGALLGPIVGAAMGATAALASNIGPRLSSSSSASVSQSLNEMATLSKSLTETMSSVSQLSQSVGISTVGTTMTTDTSATSKTESDSASKIMQYAAGYASSFAASDTHARDMAVSATLSKNYSFAQPVSAAELQGMSHLTEGGFRAASDQAAAQLANNTPSVTMTPAAQAGQMAIVGAIDGQRAMLGGSAAPSSGQSANVQSLSNAAGQQLDAATRQNSGGTRAPMPEMTPMTDMSMEQPRIVEGVEAKKGGTIDLVRNALHGTSAK